MAALLNISMALLVGMSLSKERLTPSAPKNVSNICLLGGTSKGLSPMSVGFGVSRERESPAFEVFSGFSVDFFGMFVCGSGNPSVSNSFGLD